MAWASLEAGGGPSEYYVLDEEGTLQQEVWAGEKLVKMTIQKTVENSDIHGILVPGSMRVCSMNFGRMMPGTVWML